MICFVYNRKMDLQKKKSRKLDESHELISLARKRFQKPQSEFEKSAL